MRLTLWLLGTEILTISTDRAEPDQHDDGHTTRHDGDFQIGFTTPLDRSLTPGGVVEAQHHPPGPRR